MNWYLRIIGVRMDHYLLFIQRESIEAECSQHPKKLGIRYVKLGVVHVKLGVFFCQTGSCFCQSGSCFCQTGSWLHFHHDICVHELFY